MVIINELPARITIRKTIMTDDDKYTVILLNNFTRKYWILHLDELSLYDEYYEFEIPILECFPQGEYTYFVTPYNEFWIYEIDNNRVENSCVFDTNMFNPICIFNNPLCVFGVPIGIYDSESITGDCMPLIIYNKGLMRYRNMCSTNYGKFVQFNAYERKFK